MFDMCAKRFSDFEIEPIIGGLAVLDDEWKNSNTQSPFSRLYFVKKGSAFIVSDGKKIEMLPGNCYFIPAETQFSYSGYKDILFEKVFFHISVKTKEGFDLFSKLTGIFSVSVSSETIEKLYTLYSSKNYLDILEIKGIIYKTLADIFEHHNLAIDFTTDYSPCVSQAIEYIKTNISANMRVSEIAKATLTSTSHLSKKFKAETRFSIGRYIDELVFAEASWLLIHSSLSIQEIANNLGFADKFYFSRRFKQKTKKTPRQYRNDNKLFMY